MYSGQIGTSITQLYYHRNGANINMDTTVAGSITVLFSIWLRLSCFLSDSLSCFPVFYLTHCPVFYLTQTVLFSIWLRLSCFLSDSDCPVFYLTQTVLFSIWLTVLFSIWLRLSCFLSYSDCPVFYLTQTVLFSIWLLVKYIGTLFLWLQNKLLWWCNVSRAQLKCVRSWVSSPSWVKLKIKIGKIFCFSTKHTALRSKSKHWLAQIQDNVWKWSNMSTCWLLFLWANTEKTQLSVSLEQSGHHHYFMECNLFPPWQSWIIAHLTLNNNNSFTPYYRISENKDQYNYKLNSTY